MSLNKIVRPDPRSHAVTVRFAEDEIALLAELAKNNGLSKAAYLRQMFCNTHIAPATVRETPTARRDGAA